ncbi:MAG TPA: non-canonical purine NTP pyrophosphatase, RdgB/HAM1 family [Chitinophagaceae bacterium]|nr:non-canonical purine NTP pyrophosphatase, RdgB/HAM1 family [Chitinophagaceae bacterium]
MQLIFATNNQHKVQEVRSLLNNSFTLITLAEAGIDRDIPEPHATLEENAREKSMTIYQLTGSDCFSEDTGLEVAALGGAPGVHSARYAGAQATADQNIYKLLQTLTSQQSRAAQFRTVISLIEQGTEITFEGICKGHIAETPSGKKGFGYDPVFIPEGATRCFAEMDLEEKNQYSHRRKAFDQLKNYLLSK